MAGLLGRSNSFMGRLLAYRSLRALLVSLVLYFFAFQYCKHLFWRNPHSAFFDERHVYEVEYSALRRDEARKFIQDANDRQGGTSDFIHSRNDPVLCSAFVTVKRENVSYFPDALGSMLAGLDPIEREALYLYVLFADTNPDVNPDWNKPWLNVVDAAGGYQGLSELEKSLLKDFEEGKNFGRKGLYDYVYALEQCMKTTAPWIAVFEDDIIFADGWMAKMIDGLAKVKKRAFVQPWKKWLYMRLFYTETVIRWTDEDPAYDHMPVVLGTASLFALVVLLTVKVSSTSARYHLDIATMAVLCLITAPAFAGLYFMAGKWSIDFPKEPVLMQREGCCTQALVFPRERVPELGEYLRQIGSGQTDMLIETFADEKDYDRYALVPQVVQHVGKQSSKGISPLNTQSIWAFFFETSDPKKLKREHERLLWAGLPWDEVQTTD